MQKIVNKQIELKCRKNANYKGQVSLSA